MEQKNNLVVEEMINFCLQSLYDITYAVVRKKQQNLKLLGTHLIEANKALVVMNAVKTNPDQYLGEAAVLDFRKRVNEYMDRCEKHGRPVDIITANCVVDRAPQVLSDRARAATNMLSEPLRRLYGVLLHAIYVYKNDKLEYRRNMERNKIAAIYNRLQLERTKSLFKREVMKIEMKINKQNIYEMR